MWATTTAMSESAPNNAYIREQDGISDKVLDRTGVNVTSASATLSFRNSFNMARSGLTFCGGFLLEVFALAGYLAMGFGNDLARLVPAM